MPSYTLSAMKEEKLITQEDIDKADVRLRPVLGVPPRKYLPALFGAALLIAVFLVFFLPGIVRSGSWLKFEGEPGTASVYLGGDYKGASGRFLWFPAGEYAFRVERNGFSAGEIKLKVGGRLLGSLFFPKKTTVRYSLSADDPSAVLHSAFREYSAWSLTGKPSALYPLPSVLSDNLAALASTGGLSGLETSREAGTAGLPLGAALAKDAVSMAVSSESARDALGAAVQAVSGGAPGPLSLAGTARIAASILCSGKNGAVWLSDMLAGTGKGTEYKSRIDAIAKESVPVTRGDFPRPAGRVSLAGHEFVLFSAGTVEMTGLAPSGAHAPYAVRVPSFGIGRLEITNRQWARFIAANPRWAPANRAELIEAGLADGNYMAEWTGAEDSRPVASVSWHAARAYCEWLGETSGGSYRFVLPTEAMWEAAATAGQDSGSAKASGVWADGSAAGPAAVASRGYSSAGLADMMGNVWEWTSDPYRPYPAFAAGEFAGDEIAARGGSWANRAGDIEAGSRGGIASSHSSPFLGFRVVIVEK